MNTIPALTYTLHVQALRKVSCQFVIIPCCNCSMIVGLPYLDFALAFLLQYKLLVFVAFFGEYALMRIGVCLTVDIFLCGIVII